MSSNSNGFRRHNCPFLHMKRYCTHKSMKRRGSGKMCRAVCPHARKESCDLLKSSNTELKSPVSDKKHLNTTTTTT